MRRQSGFTLLELLISVTIASGIIVLLTLVMRTALHSIAGAEGDVDSWQAQQFVRKQIAARLSADAFLLADSTELAFVTSLSARYGDIGPRVMVLYQYDRTEQALSYREITLPPLWEETDSTFRDYLGRLKAGQGEGWQDQILTDLSEFQFSYQIASEGPRGLWEANLPVPIPDIEGIRFEMHFSNERAVEWLVDSQVSY